MIRAALLIACLLLAPALRAETIDLQPPPPGQHAEQQIEADAEYQLDALFELLDYAEAIDRDLHLVLRDGRRLILRDWYAEDGSERARLIVAGAALSSAEVLIPAETAAAAPEPPRAETNTVQRPEPVPEPEPVPVPQTEQQESRAPASEETLTVEEVQELILNGGDPTAELPAPAAGGMLSGGGDFTGGGVRGGFNTARRLLFPNESAGDEFGFHSYLLIANGSPEGPAFERRAAAIEAWLGEVSSLAGMLSLGVAVEELNVFWLPMREFGGQSAEQIHPQLRSSGAALLPQLIANYDFDRARALAHQLDLSGDGPWIVSHPQPLSVNAAPQPAEQLMVQDLSRAPPKLVRSWVRHFKSKLADEEPGLGSRMRGFFLGVRNEISNLADGLSITRDAVAMTLGGGVPEAAAAEAPPAPESPPAMQTAGLASGAPGNTLVERAPLPPANGATQFQGAADSGVAPADQSDDAAAARPQAVTADQPLPLPRDFSAEDAAANTWLRTRAELQLAQQQAALNAKLIRRQQLLLDLQLQRERVGLLGEQMRDLDLLDRLVNQMRDNGSMSSSAPLEVSLALGKLRAARADALRAQHAAEVDWLRLEQNLPPASGLPTLDESALPQHVDAARELSREWHPALRLRRAESAFVSAGQSLPALANVCLQNAQDTLDLNPRCMTADDSVIVSGADELPALHDAAASEAVGAWLEYRQRADEVAALVDGARAAAAVREAITRQFDIGQRSLQELLAALAQNLDMQQRLLAARAAQVEAGWQLLLATGQLPQHISDAR